LESKKCFSESWSSDLSSDSCEYYQTEIFGLLPSSQAHRRLHADAVTDHQDERLDRVSWNPSVPLRDLPICLQDKRELRERQHLQRSNIDSWDSWRRSQQKTRRRLKEHVGGAISGLLPWRHTLHKIEGQFGDGVKAYFVFLRYLLCLNLLYCIIIAGSVLTPRLVFGHNSNTLGFQNYSFKDFFVGSVSTFIMTVVGYKHSWLTGNRFSSNLSYKVFCGWDFCIQNPQAASLKHNFIRNELKMDLEEQTFQQRVQQRTLKHWVQLIFLRVLLNFLVLVLLGSAFILIYFAIEWSQIKCENHWTVCLMLEYLPPITMTTVNYILPHVFSKISEFEDYSLTIQLNLTLIRSIFLKLASLGIYLFFFINAQFSGFIYCPYDMQVFFLFQMTVSHHRLFVERFPSSNLAQILGKQQFEISSNVLDLVNSQTVTWVGVFYCPLLPAISAIRLLFLFYFKKFTVVRCCVPPQRMFRTASSSVLFHFMLLLGLFMAVITLVVNINRFVPGGCGPFEGNRTVFNVTSVCIKTLPNPVQTTISYISSEAFAFALLLAEIFLHPQIPDFQIVVSQTNIVLLKNHTSMEILFIHLSDDVYISISRN
uniref:Transmembrane channel-like protein n=1 Tax=Cyprinus carpio TaxID=7962 RepID=A0A8C2JBA9_CYPCA